ncbi:hypothetical protein [Paenibacillus turpanensis]|uniref:hypothetical protein n=1 Tax=Paenibacillus turpanensis TaxID=2689078 RepID=UPI0014093670|nr:hypothetical protein [Paenibacillus turpanensis]
MRLGILGNCAKHDLVLVLAALIQSHRGESVSVGTKEERVYPYFNGEVSQIAIHPLDKDEGSIIIHDLHEIPEEASIYEKIFLVTTFDRYSIDFMESASRVVKFDAVVLISAPCSITPKFIEQRLQEQESPRFYVYEEDAKRRIDMVFDGRIPLKKLSADFVDTMNDILIEHFEVPSKSIKKLWSYAAKRLGG